LRSIKENFESNAKLTKEDIAKFDDLLTIVVEEYTKMAKSEVQKAFFLNFEGEIKNLLNNYIDNVGAYLDDTNVKDEFGDNHEPDKYLMRSIEEKVGVSESARDSFRQEVYRKVIKTKDESGEFDYKSHARLREALEKQLFDERADTIRITVSTRNPDPEALQKLNGVIDTLVKYHGYTAESANQLLRYVASLMSRTT
jgi:serine protein kinase